MYLIFCFWDAVFYLQLYSVDHNVDKTLSFYSVSHSDPFSLSESLTCVSFQLAIINGAGVIGRLGANHMGDIYGVWNVHAPVTLITGATIYAILGV